MTNAYTLKESAKPEGVFVRRVGFYVLVGLGPGSVQPKNGRRRSLRGRSTPLANDTGIVAQGIGWPPCEHRLACGMAGSSKKSSQPKALLLGVGLDSDGHQRLTTGKNFALVGGSKETHEEMTEKVVKINEKLKAKGKELQEVSREEFDDIAHEVGLRRNRPEQN